MSLKSFYKLKMTDVTLIAINLDKKMAPDAEWCRWSYPTWCFLSTVGTIVIFYSTLVNTWVLKMPVPATCQSQMQQTTLVSDASTCKPCEASVESIIENDPISRLDFRLGRWDNSRSYKLFDYAALGSDYAELSKARKVSLASQTSVDRLHELLKIAAHWSGPISVAVYVVGDELTLLRGFIVRLMRCDPSNYARMAFHIAIAAGKTLELKPLATWSKECTPEALPMSTLSEETKTWKRKNPVYPQNHLRNLARKNCQTPFVYLVDIDIVPSKGMSESLEKFFDKMPKCKLCAYVVPTYEVHQKVVSFPANKSELLTLSKKKLALPFHAKIFIYNQFATNFSRWEQNGINESSETHISHNVTNFEFFYEPFYVAPDKVPAHDERFVGYGFTRNSQVYEMFLMGYQFCVLSPVFTVHWGIQQRRSRPAWREKQNSRNSVLFDSLKKELFVRFRKDPLNLVKRPQEKQKKT